MSLHPVTKKGKLGTQISGLPSIVDEMFKHIEFNFIKKYKINHLFHTINPNNLDKSLSCWISKLEFHNMTSYY